MRPTRREILGSVAWLTASAAASAAPPEAPEPGAPRLVLRLLATSDLHMAVMDWDYYRARPDHTQGLVRVASLIARARQERANTLLFDNGDLLQGNPLGDFLARPGGLAEEATHPIYRVMNAMGYDAATIGNHEFNFGLEFLERALKGAAFPQVSANILRTDGSSFLPATTVLERSFVDEAGIARVVRIGVIGFAPPQIMIWDKSRLEGRLGADDIVAAAEKHVPALRASCDVVVALCHAGMSGAHREPGEENAALHLAAVPGIDVIVTGHSHRVFPGPDYATLAGADATRGTLEGVPAVMPGFWGSHLGVIDLTLTRMGDRWAITDFAAEARPIARRDGNAVVPLVEVDAKVAALIAPEHAATRAWVDQPAGRFAEPVHSYFVWTGLDRPSAVVNAAQIDYVRPLLAGTDLAGLPLLSTAAPFKTGYTPDSYIDIAAGAVALREVADLYVYPNTLVVVKVTGAIVREWLEHAARVFARIEPGTAGVQSLLEARVPSYNFDTFSGLTWAVDPTKPPRTDAEGRIVTPSSGRIVDLAWQGKPIAPDQPFLVVTNNYRADGGGKFPGLGSEAIVLRAPDGNRDVILRWVAAQEAVHPPIERSWRFAPIGRRTTVAFDSAPAARAHLAEVPGLREVESTRAGYARYAFDLD